MKLFPNTVNGVVKSLTDIFDNNQYADKVIERVLKSNPKWGARDRAFIAESVYEIVRWKRLIQYLSPAEDYYHWFGTYWTLQGRSLPEWKEFRKIDHEKILKKQETITQRTLRQSIPDWLDQMGQEQLGDRWEPELESLNKEAEVVLRVNTLKTSKSKLREDLEALDISAYTVKGYPDALVLERRRNVFRTNLFKDGLFEVQDASSQQVAEALDVAPGLRVIDACAGAGGKSLHLAALMENKGRIVAMDLEAWKLKNTKLRARRAGVSIIETRPIEGSKTIKRLYQSADRLLLDVPCSGLGVLRRNPDTKWKLSPESIGKVQGMQSEILTQYPSMLKPGGILVYATCSILPSENNLQIEAFLNSPAGQSFELLEEKQVFAHESGFDGFYIAKMRKKA
ncbi:16S rRNA (cytosine967-C5)-methyltransferase [Cyclobacterium lianum]|uniref:16S rRNA (Cytosine967-C5)-methyltransferase n=1 Tax=Cyclobacterium lianum TaxID=388280 RepID=A0A1M7IA20_9BACT|nr:RsmB/NOP family class I SAM-dependent RNA methyltransferase [Cyclobacterium lianum]SHM37499.1 16S rRNA (cytosine967-C5)-methyltransferase [Cyclobacterium lianum]